MRLAISALVILLVSSACGGSAAATQTRTPGLQRSPQPTVATPTTSLRPLGFSCRLPIFRPRYGEGSPPPVVGFLSFPDGKVSVGAAPLYLDPQQNIWPGSFLDSFSYEPALSRWVPAPRNAVSPDGRHYAYASGIETVIHVVDVLTSHAQPYTAVPATSTPGEQYVVVLDYATEGIYFGLGHVLSLPSSIWLMDPNTGAIRKVADQRDIQAVDASAAWLVRPNPADPVDPSKPGGPAADTIERFDLVTGARTTWLYMPGSNFGVLGLDHTGHPIVYNPAGFVNGDYNFEVLLLTGPGTAQVIFKGLGTELEVPGQGLPFAFPSGDSHGVWFGSSTGIYLYSPAAGLRKVSNLAAYPGNGCM